MVASTNEREVLELIVSGALKSSSELSEAVAS
jgi:DNA-binding CsgD family transcriptional regulator